MEWLKLTMLLGICICISSTARVDQTLEDYGRGAEVVRSVLSRMEQANLYNSISVSTQKRQVYEQFMREMAYTESEDGQMTDPSTDGGIWRPSENIFEQTQSYTYNNLYQLICDVFCIDWRSLSYRDLTKPLYSGLTVQIYLYHLEITGNGLPESATDRQKAAFWLLHFLSNQQQFFEKWLRCVAQLREIEVCRVNTDVVFVVDSSGSIGRTNFQLVRDYVYNYTDNLLDRTENNRVGIILYSSGARVEVSLDYLNNNTKDDLLNRIQAVIYTGGATNTPEGLCLLKTMNWRDSISTLRLAVVLTDGRSNRESRNCGNGTNTLQTTAQEIHNRNPQIVVSAVGVANAVVAELQIIATDNDTVDFIREFDPNLLEQNQYYRSYSACFKVVQTVSNNVEATEGTADRGSVSRLQFTASSAEGVSIKICIEDGGIVIYGSYSNPNPGPALHDFSEELSERRSQCYTSHIDQSTIVESETCLSCENTNRQRRKRQADDTEVSVYITIAGSENGSRFSVASEDGRGLVENLQTGCRGDSSLCASDATVACTMKINTSALLCECAYVTGLENLPLCESEEVQTTDHGAFLGLVIAVAALCVVGLAVTMIVMVGALLKLNTRKSHQKNGQMIVENKLYQERAGEDQIEESGEDQIEEYKIEKEELTVEESTGEDPNGDKLDEEAPISYTNIDD